MADLKDLIKEFKLIGDAQLGVGKFVYAYPHEINEDRNKNYPIILLEKHPLFKYISIKDNMRTYTFRINFFDIAAVNDIDTEKISSMEDLAEKYFREFINRSQTVSTLWFLIDNSVVGNQLSFKHNDMLAGLTFTFDVKIFTDCDTGIFNYI